jgi:hypothetical protein
MPSAPESPLAPQNPRHSIAQDMYQHIFDRGGPVAHRTNKPLHLCRQWYLQAAPVDAAGFAMFCSDHLPDPPCMVCQVILIAWVLH